jgi:hypothetical protein
MKIFDVRCNLGSKDKPLFAIIPIDENESRFEAKRLANVALKDCTQMQTWELYEDGKPTDYTIDTFPKAEFGVEVAITINAASFNAINHCLKEITSRINRGDELGQLENGSARYSGYKYKFSLDSEL